MISGTKYAGKELKELADALTTKEIKVLRVATSDGYGEETFSPIECKILMNSLKYLYE